MRFSFKGFKVNPVALSLFLSLIFLGSAVAGIQLQDVYDSAGSGEGYDKLVVLDPDEVYTGGLDVGSGVTCCIHGNRAAVDLDGNSIIASGSGTILDIDYCVLYNGMPCIGFYLNASGSISMSTLTDNSMGVALDGAGEGEVLLEGNNICFNSTFGVAVYDEISYPEVSYNNTFGNTGGNYMYYCPG